MTQRQKYKPFFHHTTTSKVSIDSDNTLKKKMFSRKPASPHYILPSEKKKIDNVVSPKSSKIVEKDCEMKNNEGDPKTKLKLLVRKERPTEYFKSQRQTMLVNTSLKNAREVFYSPKSSKQNLLAGVTSLSNLSISNFSQSQFMERDDSKDMINGYNRKQSKDKIQGYSFRESNSQNKLKTKTSSYTMLMGETDQLQTTKSISASEARSGFEECCFCRNNKKMVEMLTEKYHKMQDDIKHKDYLIAKLNEQFDNLVRKQKKLQKTIEMNNVNFKQTIANLTDIKLELEQRIDQINREYVRKTERIKYLQIQNSMLHRYKDEYQLITYEYEQLLRENEYIKRHIAMKKPKEVNSPHKKINIIKGQYHLEQSYNKTNKNTIIKQDDQISLSFSQLSLQQ